MPESKTQPEERAFPFLRLNRRPAKPRTTGVTEIRGPYYSSMGTRYLSDVLETMGAYVDSLKFAGGSFTLMPRRAVKEIIDLCHDHGVLVSTGGFIEYVLTQGPEAVNQYIAGCKELGFDIIEISAGFISIPTDDWLRLVERVQKAGLKAKPEVGIQFGAGGASDRRRTGGRGNQRSPVGDCPGPAVSRRGRLHDHDRIGRNHRKRHHLAHRRDRRDRQFPGAGEGHV